MKYNYEISRQLERELDKLRRENKKQYIMYEIDFVEQVFKGLQDAENEKLISTEELLKRIEQWEK